MKLARRVFLAQAGGQILKRPSVLLGHGMRIRFDPLRIDQQERFQSAAANFVGLDKLPGPARGAQRPG